MFKHELVTTDSESELDKVKFGLRRVQFESDEKNIFKFSSDSGVDYTNILNLIDPEKITPDIKFPLYLSSSFQSDSLAERILIGFTEIEKYTDTHISIKPTLYKEFSFMKNVPYKILPESLQTKETSNKPVTSKYLLGFEIHPDDDIDHLICKCE